jgi:misacylated tRNA(Ala) deacylase
MKCSKCGILFNCAANDDCWCMKVSTQSIEEGIGCKCPKCLFGSQKSMGDLHCQNDSFARHLETFVLENGGGTVKLHDTVLFPEGGGQPSDQGSLQIVGTLEVYQVISVERTMDGILHHVSPALPEHVVSGTKVLLNVDWNRRFDHMVQHSSQHLLSALLFKKGYQTVGWSLGNQSCYVDLSPIVNPEDLPEIEQEVNAAINQHRQVTVVKKSDSACLPDLEDLNIRPSKTSNVDGKGLHKGVIRSISIAGIDTNLCCGTHITNTSQLTCLKLLQTEKISRKTGAFTRLYFVAGNRVLTLLNTLHASQIQTASILATSTDQVPMMVEKIVAEKNKMTRAIKSMIPTLVAHHLHLLSNNPSKKVTIHIQDVGGMEQDYVGQVVKVLNTMALSKDVVSVSSGLLAENQTITIAILSKEPLSDFVSGLKLPDLKGATLPKRQNHVFQGRCKGLKEKDFKLSFPDFDFIIL